MPAGERRFGNPRTEEERRARHFRLTGSRRLPKRGYGLRRRRRKSSRKIAEALRE